MAEGPNLAGIALYNLQDTEVGIEFMNLWMDGKHDEACRIIRDLPTGERELIRNIAIECGFTLMDDVRSPPCTKKLKLSGLKIAS